MEHNILMTTQTIEHCPICTKDKLLSYLQVQDHSISKETFNLDICVQCGFVFTNPQPIGESLSQYYQSEDYISHSGTKKGLINKLYHTVQQYNLSLKYKAVKKHVPRGTWVDYGAGNGAFLKFLQNKNIAAIGFEPDDSARLLAQAKKVEILPSEQYKAYSPEIACITMWHVLEHVDDLVGLLQTHHSKLKFEGVLAIAVPNHHSYDAKFYKENWAAYDVPRHLWHFTENNVNSLAKQNGFEHISTRPMIFDAYYISMLSEKYKNRSPLRGAVLGALSNFYARISGYPFSSQIYIFKKT